MKARPAAASLAVYLGFVAMGTGLLVYNPIHLIDFEELDYGELPVAILDGLVTPGNLPGFQTYSREGSLLFWAPAIALVFAMLGPSLFSLKLAGVLIGGLWAVVWYGLSRLITPRLDPWLTALGLAVPLPLIQLSGISITSVMTHFGASLWHGTTLLALTLALAVPARARGAAFASGLATGIGVYTSYSLIPLLPGALWVALRGARLELAKPWALGALPGLGLAVAFLGRTPLDGIDQADATGIYAIRLLAPMLAYGAGIYVGAERVDLSSNVFSGLAVAYPILLATIVATALRGSPKTPGTADPAHSVFVVQGLILSVLGQLSALWITRYRIDLWAFDGLRYLTPLAAPLTLLLFHAAARLPRKISALAVGVFVGFNLASYFTLLIPFEAATFQHLVRGYHGSFFLHADYRRPTLQVVPPGARSDHYAPWMGVADELRGRLDIDTVTRDGRFASPEGELEYWRGVGLARTISSDCVEAGDCVPEGTPSELTGAVWQGVGMSCECENGRGELRGVPLHSRDDYLLGVSWGGFREYDTWPRDQPFSAEGADRFARLFAHAGKEAELRAHVARRPLPLFATSTLRDHAAHLFQRAHGQLWWLQSR